MLPITLCPEAVPVALVGIGDKTVHRLAQLDEGDFTVTVFSDAPSPDLVLAAGSTGCGTGCPMRPISVSSGCCWWPISTRLAPPTSPTSPASLACW